MPFSPNSSVVLFPVATHAAAQLRVHPRGESVNGVIVKVDIGQGREEAVHQKAGDLFGVLTLALAGIRQPDQAAHQRIL